MDVERFRHEYEKALRAWHLAWSERVGWHADHFEPIEEQVSGLVNEDVLKRREWLRDLEERAFDRFLVARAVYEQALASEGG